MFTCATDTGELIWNNNGTLQYCSNYTYDVIEFGIFEFRLLIKTGNALVSTATVQNVHYSDNGTLLSCSDNSSIAHVSNSNTDRIKIKGKQIRKCIHQPIFSLIFVLCSGSSSPPHNLTFCFTSVFVIISWVSPLDTPLCVHSYTVTVRNSSQVMVYNTTDNRSSLSITDLTSDGEYSVTVAGRDGAGRLGQESEELNIGPSPSGLGVLHQA